MDDLLIANAYENQTTGMDTVTQKLIAFAFEDVLTLKLCLGKNLVFWIGSCSAPLCCPSVTFQSQKQFSRWFSLVRDSVRNSVINIPPVCFV